jgi:ferritin
MAVSEEMVRKINAQIAAEIYSAYYYLGMAVAFDRMGLKVFSQRFFQQFDEEMFHARKFLDYLLKVGATVELEAIRKPPQDWESAEQIIQAARDHESYVTSLINALVAQAEEDKDYATRSFLQWYVDEQVEEESSMQELLDLVKMAGPERLLMVEERLKGMMAAASQAAAQSE